MAWCTGTSRVYSLGVVHRDLKGVVWAWCTGTSRVYSLGVVHRDLKGVQSSKKTLGATPKFEAINGDLMPRAVLRAHMHWAPPHKL